MNYCTAAVFNTLVKINRLIDCDRHYSWLVSTILHKFYSPFSTIYVSKCSIVDRVTVDCQLNHFFFTRAINFTGRDVKVSRLKQFESELNGDIWFIYLSLSSVLTSVWKLVSVEIYNELLSIDRFFCFCCWCCK